MPPTSTRCTFKHKGQRCIRNGTGNPCLCAAHRVAMAEHAKRADRPLNRAKTTIGSVIDDVLYQGKSLDWDKMGEAISDFAYTIGGSLGGGYAPNMDTKGAFDPRMFFPNGYVPGARTQAQQAPPAPAPPRFDYPALNQLVCELGFPPGAKPPKADVEARRRQLARKFHPDLAGTDERKRKSHTTKMMQINNAADSLIEEIDRGAW